LVLVVALFVVANTATGFGGGGGELLLTPFGYMPRSCVHGVGDKAHVIGLDDSGLLRVRHNDSQVHGYPRCGTTAHLKARQVKMGKIPLEHVSTNPSGNDPAYPNGWAAYSEFQNGDVFTNFVGQWTVPSNPAQQNLQTLFLFTGFQNEFFDEEHKKGSPDAVISIIQPVLQFGPSAAGGGNYWSIASWYVTSTGTALYSTLTPVNPGDLIVGTMKFTGSSWLIDTLDKTTGKDTQITYNTQVSEIWAFVTLEVYSITSCGQYPNGAVLFSNLALTSTTGPVVPQWIVAGQSGCGEAVTIVDPYDVKILF